MEKRLPSRIQQWLNERGITDAIIEAHGLDWNGKEIVIPVRDEHNNHLFNKYRRDPEVSEGPKYRYEAGSKSALFGLPSLANGGPVVICEGEFDALSLISKGFSAVSSTGGSGTFDQDWQEHFLNKEVFICYDYDKPGFKGAYNVQSIIPWAKIIWLPSRIGEHGDVTDYFTKLGKGKGDFIMLMNDAKSYTTPADWDEYANDKKQLKVIEKEYTTQVDWLMEIARMVRTRYESDAPIQTLIDMYMNRLGEVKRQIKYFQVKRDTTNPDRVAEAKRVPIPTYLKIARDKTTKCIWHDEKTASMHYYEKQNRVHCFGCGKGGDVIDVVQALNRCNLKDALQFILKDNE